MLDRFRILQSTSIEETRNTLIRVHGIRSFEPHGDKARFAIAASHLQLSRIALSYCSYDTPVDITFSASASVRQQIGLRGTCQSEFGGHVVAVDQEFSCVVPSGTVLCSKFGPGFQQLMLRIDAAALRQYVRTFFGVEPRGSLEFYPAVRFETPAAQHIRRLLMFFAAEVDTFGTALPSAMASEFEDLIMMGFLLGNRSNCSHLFERRPQDIAPAAVRLAEEFMEANWQIAITVDELSAVTGVPLRSLFRSFKRHRGYTPMAFLKATRLRRARDLLEHPSAQTSVTGVAFSCQFQNPGHFAKDYSRLFGELPSQTLRRSLGGQSPLP